MLRFLAKIFHSILHILAFFKAALTIFLIIALWLLATRPITIDFATSDLEERLNELSPNYGITVADTKFTLISRQGFFIFEASKVAFSRADNTPILTIPEINLQLSLPELLRGEMIIENISLEGTELRIYRENDGVFNFGFARNATDAALISPLLPADLGRLFLEYGNDDNQFQSLSLLNSHLIFIDEITGTELNASNLDFTVVRREQGILDIEDSANSSLLMQELATESQNPYLSIKFSFDLPIGDNIVTLNSHAFYSPEVELIPLNIDFSPFSPPQVAEQFPELIFLSSIDAPLNATADVELSTNLSIESFQARFFLGEGSLNLPAYFEFPPSFDYAQFYLSYDNNSSILNISDILFNLGFPKLTANSQISWQDGEVSIIADAHLTEMPMDDLDAYWPMDLNLDARKWVLENISEGVADNARFHVDTTYHLETDTTPSYFETESLYGDIDYTDLNVQWIEGTSPPFTNISGTANYDAESFSLNIDTAEIKDIEVHDAEIRISGFDTDNINMNIALPLEGNLATLIEILSAPRLDIFNSIDLPISDIRGSFIGETNLTFPLIHDLTTEDIEVIAEAELQNVSIINNPNNDTAAGFKGYDIDEGMLALNVSTTGENPAMELNGSIHINDTPAQFSWQENFNPSENTAVREVEISLPLDQSDRERLGLNIETWLEGTIPLTINYQKLDDELSILRGEADLSHTQITLPRLGYRSMAGTNAFANFRLALDNSDIIRIPEFSLGTEELSIRGATNLYRNAEGKIQLSNIEFSELITPETNIKLEIHSSKQNDSDNIGYDAHISGERLNLSGIIHGDDEDGSSDNNTDFAEILSLPMALHIEADIDRVILEENVIWNNLILNGNYDGEWWDYVDFYATYQNRPMRLQFIPAMNIDYNNSPAISQRLAEIPAGELSEQHQLYAEFADISPIFSLLNRPSPMEGGSIIVTGITNHSGAPLDLTGHIEMGPQQIRRAPIMARLLNAVSLIGLAESLTSSGISFSRLTSEFRWNNNSLTLADGRISGPSIGLTFSGNFSPATEGIDFSGTVVPINTVNHILGAIPIFGTMFADSEGDIFAATYHISGNLENTDISVNPLSILTPGFVRRLFFVDNSQGLEDRDNIQATTP